MRSSGLSKTARGLSRPRCVRYSRRNSLAEGGGGGALISCPDKAASSSCVGAGVRAVGVAGPALGVGVGVGDAATFGVAAPEIEPRGVEFGVFLLGVPLETDLELLSFFIGEDLVFVGVAGRGVPELVDLVVVVEVVFVPDLPVVVLDLVVAVLDLVVAVLDLVVVVVATLDAVDDAGNLMYIG